MIFYIRNTILDKMDTIRTIALTPTVEIINRGKTWSIEDPQIGSIVVEECNGFGCGETQSYVITKVETDQLGRKKKITINKIIKFEPGQEEDGLATIDRSAFLVLKPYFQQRYGSHGVWHYQTKARISYFTWDRYREPSTGYDK